MHAPRNNKRWCVLIKLIMQVTEVSQNGTRILYSTCLKAFPIWDWRSWTVIPPRLMISLEKLRTPFLEFCHCLIWFLIDFGIYLYIYYYSIPLDGLFIEGNIPPTSYNVVKDGHYCGEIRIGLTFTPQACYHIC